jgi:hypothetical protein
VLAVRPANAAVAEVELKQLPGSAGSPVTPTRRAAYPSSDPALLTVGTAYPSEPLQPWPALFHPPIKLPSFRPRSYIDRHRRINQTASQALE